ncbi:MAG: hypothetical protein KAX40_09245 [Herpetosiphon sp.]|nr:hypothetical protein [Herpetosiphon sp.]
MEATIFYSWQSDLPGNINRSFIQEALELAVQAISQDDTIKVEPRVDRDTLGVAGSPDIVHTILEKIDKAQVFVCDVSLINSQTEGRKTPNPNVLVELGYAMGKLGLSRIVMVMNTAYGTPDSLPFDLKTKRQTVYTLKTGEQKAEVRKMLVRQLTDALKIIFTEVEVELNANTAIPIQQTIREQLKEAIDQNKSNRAAIARNYMIWLIEQLSTRAPDFSNGGQRDELLIEALEQTIPLVVDFTQTTQMIAQYNDEECARAIYKEFEKLLAKYDLPLGFSGSYNTTDFDFYKFLGHELFVTLISSLLQESRWNTINALLETALVVTNKSYPHGHVHEIRHITQYIQLLDEYNKREKLQKISYHAHLLNQRHSEGELGELMPIQSFAESDYFLYLYCQKGLSDNPRIMWRAWSVLYIGRIPRYILESVQLKNAQYLMSDFNLDSISKLRTYLKHNAQKIEMLFHSGWWTNILDEFDYSKIGSR